MRKEVFYYSDGLKISAYLYHPNDWTAGDAPRPAVICITGYSGRKDLATIDVPERLAQEGYFTLAPDYRGFGRAEGLKGRHRPLEQAQDTYDGITFMETVEGVDPDRIGIYGTSYGGAHAIWVAAFDERVKVAVSAVGVGNGDKWLRSVFSAYEWIKLKEKVLVAARERVLTGKRTMVPRTYLCPDDPDKPKPKLIEEVHGIAEVNEYDLESAEALFRYRPEWVAGRISPRPVLFICGEDDVMVPVEDGPLAVYAACGEPKKLVRIPHGRHNDVYKVVNPECFERCVKETITWFGQYL